MELLDRTKAEVTSQVEAQGEMHKAWIQLSDSIRDVTAEREEERTVKEAIALFFGRLQVFQIRNRFHSCNCLEVCSTVLNSLRYLILEIRGSKVDKMLAALSKFLFSYIMCVIYHSL